MITKLEIKNFRGIEEGNIELAPLTILVGPNNSGKSTILEALFLLPNPLRQVPYNVNDAISLVGYRHHILNTEGYAFLFRNYQYEDKEVVITCIVKNDENMDKEKRISLYMKKEENSSLIKVDMEEIYLEGVTIRKESLGSVNLYTWATYAGGKFLLLDDALLFHNKFIDKAVEHIHSNWIKITNSKITKYIAEKISSLVHEKYIDLTLEPYLLGNISLNVYMTDGTRIRISDLGDGIQIYIILRILSEITKARYLLIDDIEASLNPILLHELADWFNDLLHSGKQIVVSTHSIDAIKILAGMNEEKAKIYLTRLEDGKFEAKQLTLKDVEGLDRAGVDIRIRSVQDLLF